MKGTFALISVLAILATLSLLSCSRNEEIFCDVTLEVSVKGSPDYVSIVIDPSLKGNMFRNLNTAQDYPMPAIVGGTASMRVLKGLYMIAFDGKITLTDGTVRTVRFSAHNSPDKAVYLLGDSETISLELTML